MKIVPASLWLASLGLLAGTGQPAEAAYSCNVTATPLTGTYTGTNVDSSGSSTLTCTRLSTDANTLTYRLKADNGGNASATAPFRRTRLGATTSYLFYIVRRGTTAGGAAACNTTTNWAAPTTGTTNVATGTLNFGAGLTASATWNYCVRTRVGAGGNAAAPSSGSYVDSFNVTGQYPNNDAGALTAPASAAYTMTVPAVCTFVSNPAAMSFAYTAFRTTAMTLNRAFNIRCSAGVAWSVAVSPQFGVLSGINYRMAITTPASGTSVGTGANQSTNLRGTVAAGQAGTCNTSTCSATQAHVVTVTY